MLIALFIAILAGGGSEQLFLIPDVEKKIKKEISDKDRKAELKALYKEASKAVKTFRKQDEKQVKTIEKSLKDSETTRPIVESHFDKRISNRLAHETQMVIYGLEFRAKLGQEEFQNIIQNSILPSEKQGKKNDKVQSKQDQKVSSLLIDLKTAIEQEVKKEEPRAKLLENFKDFEEFMVNLLKDLQQFNYEDEQALQNRKVQKEELEMVYKNLNDSRNRFQKEFLDMHFSIIDLCTPDESIALSKALNKIFKL